jgi:O-antigen ligase
MTILMLFFFVRFNLLFPELLAKYLKGVDLWEMGYQFSNSIGIHAPALNMHLAFVSICNLYFVFSSFKNHQKLATKIVHLLLFGMSFFFVLFVNTRMALFNALVGFVIVFIFEIKSHLSTKKIIITGVTIVLLLSGILYLFVQKNPYMKEKYSSVTFAYMDKIGKLDEIDHPEIKVFNSFVTRLSIWKSAWELSVKNLPFGVGASDGKPELFKYYKDTDQKFLAEFEFPTHNQFLDFLLKFGILGPLVVVLYIGTIGYLGFDLKNGIIISFFFLFFISNLTDDFLLRFDGIVFSGFWSSIFASFWLQKKTLDKVPRVV